MRALLLVALCGEWPLKAGKMAEGMNDSRLETGLAAGIIFEVPANQEVCFGEELGE